MEMLPPGDPQNSLMIISKWNGFRKVSRMAAETVWLLNNNEGKGTDSTCAVIIGPLWVQFYLSGWNDPQESE